MRDRIATCRSSISLKTRLGCYFQACLLLGLGLVTKLFKVLSFILLLNQQLNSLQMLKPDPLTYACFKRRASAVPNSTITAQLSSTARL